MQQKWAKKAGRTQQSREECDSRQGQAPRKKSLSGIWKTKHIGLQKRQKNNWNQNKFLKEPVILVDLPARPDSVEPTVLRHNSVLFLLRVDDAQDPTRFSSKRIPSKYSLCVCMILNKVWVWKILPFTPGQQEWKENISNEPSIWRYYNIQLKSGQKRLRLWEK